jgi:hypothetical protein
MRFGDIQVAAQDIAQPVADILLGIHFEVRNRLLGPSSQNRHQ